MAWEDTSMATPPTPAATISARSPWSSIASGVVWPASRAWPRTMYWIVPTTPVARPRAWRSASQR